MDGAQPTNAPEVVLTDRREERLGLGVDLARPHHALDRSLDATREPALAGVLKANGLI